MLACHDLRTPLATVHGFAHTLARSEELDETTARYVEMINAAAAQLAELIDDLSVVARLAGGRYDPPLRAVDTLELAQSAAERLGDERVLVSGEGAEVELDAEAAERAVGALARCALTARRLRGGRAGRPRPGAGALARHARLGAGAARRGPARPRRRGRRARRPGARRERRGRRGNAHHPPRMSDRFVNVDDYAEAARERLEPGAYGYVAGGAGDEHTLRGNAAAFERWELRPRVLVDVGSVTAATTVLGSEVALPVLVAPTAFQRLCDPEGELATARAAASAGTVMTLSTLSSVTPAELAAAAPGRDAVVPALLVARPRVHAGPRRGRGRGRLRRADADRRPAGRRPPRARRPRGLRAPGRPPAPEPAADAAARGLPPGAARGRRRHAHLARPRVAALGLPAAARGQGHPDRRGRAARGRARRGRGGRLESRRPPARRRAADARRRPRGGRGGRRAGRGAGRRRHPPRHGRAQGARARRPRDARRPGRALRPGGRRRSRVPRACSSCCAPSSSSA